MCPLFQASQPLIRQQTARSQKPLFRQHLMRHHQDQLHRLPRSDQLCPGNYRLLRLFKTVKEPTYSQWYPGRHVICILQAHYGHVQRNGRHDIFAIRRLNSTPFLATKEEKFFRLSYRSRHVYKTSHCKQLEWSLKTECYQSVSRKFLTHEE